MEPNNPPGDGEKKMSKYQWAGDPEKYAEIAKPFETREEAEKVCGAFFNAVRQLREQYRIPELIVSYQVYAQGEKAVEVLAGSGGWGNQLYQAKLARRSADSEFKWLIRMLEDVPKLSSLLITDPKADDLPE
jgi:hypothetical protein